MKIASRTVTRKLPRHFFSKTSRGLSGEFGTDEASLWGVSVHWAVQRTLEVPTRSSGRDGYDGKGSALTCFVRFGAAQSSDAP